MVREWGLLQASCLDPGALGKFGYPIPYTYRWPGSHKLACPILVICEGPGYTPGWTPSLVDLTSGIYKHRTSVWKHMRISWSGKFPLLDNTPLKWDTWISANPGNCTKNSGGGGLYGNSKCRTSIDFCSSAFFNNALLWWIFSIAVLYKDPQYVVCALSTRRTPCISS